MDMVTGKVQLEVGVVEGEKAREDPVGKGRKGPNHSPELGKPDRPVLDRTWLTSRLSLCKVCPTAWGGGGEENGWGLLQTDTRPTDRG